MLCYSVDQSAPELLEKAKYVLHGDFSLLTDMKTKADEWATNVCTSTHCLFKFC